MAYEFGGPFGAAAITLGLPALLYAFAVTCNDVSGCPIPSLLPSHSRALTWANVKEDTGLNNVQLSDFFSWSVLGVTVAYYAWGLFLWRILPAREVRGTKLVKSGKALTYRFNAFSASMATLSICAAGTYLQGPDFVIWTFISENYIQLLTSNILISTLLAAYLYIHSFSIPPPTNNSKPTSLRETAAGGTTGSIVYDFFIGRELNPRVTLPLLGEVDVKTWCEMAPGLTLWLLLDLAFLMKQLRLFGGVSYSIALVTAVQGWYILSSQFNESSILTMMDITTDGMGFMLSFGDLVWVPFLYSTQTRYLSTYPVMLGWWNTVGITCVFAVGLYIFKASNHQKWLFRLEPSHPDVRGLKSLKTKRGTRLLISGWWGKSRHINYLGDWMQAWPFSLPTGVAGYVILPAHSVLSSASLGNDEARYMADGTGRVVVQGEARGWGMILTYFYILYFAILLIHRERRDDAMCEKKYGNDWETYKGVVRWRIIPGVY